MAHSTVTELAAQDQVVIKTLANGQVPEKTNGSMVTNGLERSDYLLGRNIHKSFPVIVSGKGNYEYTHDGRAIFDATGGAAVSCLGHGDKRVIQSILRQMETGITYLATIFFANSVVEALCKELILGTGGKMERVYLTGSGLCPKPCIHPMDTQLTLSRFRGYGSCHKTLSTILL